MEYMNYAEFLKTMGLTNNENARAKYDDFVETAKGTLSHDTEPKWLPSSGRAPSPVAALANVEKDIKTPEPAVTDTQAAAALNAAEKEIKPEETLEEKITRTNAAQIAGEEERDNADVNAYDLGKDGVAASKVDAVSAPSPVLAAEVEKPIVEEPVDDRKGFWDALYNKKDALDAVGIPMFGYSSEKATDANLDKLIAQNPNWYAEYKRTGSVSIPDSESKEEEVVIDKEEEKIVDEIVNEETVKDKVAEEPIIETQEEEVIDKVMDEAGWKNEDGSVNWDYIGQVAKSSGMSIAGLFQSAIAGYLAAYQGRALGAEETVAGRNRIKEEQERLAAEQESQNIKSDERQFDMQKKLSELQYAQDDIQRKYQTARDEADKLFEIDRDKAAHTARMEEIAAQEEAATSRLWAAASINKAANDTEKQTQDPLSLRDSEIAMP